MKEENKTRTLITVVGVGIAFILLMILNRMDNNFVNSCTAQGYSTEYCQSAILGN